MRILMYETCAGPQGVWRAGDIVDVPENDARALIDAGWAEAETEAVETATPQSATPQSASADSSPCTGEPLGATSPRAARNRRPRSGWSPEGRTKAAASGGNRP